MLDEINFNGCMVDLVKGIGVVGAIATLLGVALTLAISTKKVLREITKSVIIFSLKLQAEWNALLEEAKQDYEKQTGKPREKIEQEVEEVAEKAKKIGESAASTVSPI